ncbi:MAG: TM0106 family RecB-like putative nuclease [Patescibacteria group bacterium]|nr:TM0106 family RecB-like putative nuclease [Patescibacteria group bacterium]
MCPGWVYHDQFSDPKQKGEIPELALKLMEQGVLHEKEYIKDLEFEEVKAIDSDEAFRETVNLMQKGVGLIYQGSIETEIDDIKWHGRPDLLKKFPGKSKFGNWQYYPIDIKSSTDLRPDHKHQLAFYSEILKRIQGKEPEKIAIINKNKKQMTIPLSSEITSKMYAKANEIISILKGQKPLPHLKGGCKQSPWGHMCLKESESKNDIALIYNVRESTLNKLRSNGLETVLEIAELNPNKPQYKIAKNTWQRLVLQAQALVKKDLIWLQKPNFDEGNNPIYFDIEGDPLLGIDYLFGFWIGNTQEFKYFLASRPEDEEKMWKEFLAWLPTLPKDYLMYHYAPYEKIHVEMLEKKYGGSKDLDLFKSKLVDLFDVIKKSVIFPLYFYSIKDLAKSRFVNYKWRHQKAGGAQSIFWYEKWLETGDRKVLQDIIDYNEDDVIATEHLLNWLKQYK